MTTLNEMQHKAVEFTDGPLAIYAGAGSGKTRVICCRIAHLIESGVSPSQIMAVTFTNKAAKEMKERIDSLVGPRSRSILVSTFHSACARFLRIYATDAGYDVNFSIYDDDEQKNILKEVIAELNVPEKFLSIPILKSRIDGLKNRGRTPQLFERDIQLKHQGTESAGFSLLRRFGEKEHDEIILHCYSLYQKKLKQQNAMDFNDLLLVMVQTLDSKPHVLSELQNRYRYFMVDEFQDTNPIQFELIRMLASKSTNLCIVGDDDQSIYSWRGADPGFIINFDKLYNDAKIIKLEQNYRSSDVIVRAATELINYNVGRTPKRLWTEHTGGAPIGVKAAFDAVEEAEFITNKILKQIEHGENYSSIGILYRTNAQSRAIEDSLRRRMLPYIIYGSVRFYERAEVKCLLSYLRLLVNPSDDASFVRIINTPRRGFGDKATADLKKIAKEHQQPLAKVAAKIARNEIETDMTSRSIAPLKEITALYEKWHITSQTQQDEPAAITARIIADIGFQEYLRAQYPEDADERWQNVLELNNALMEFEQRWRTQESKPQSALAAFLEEAALVVEPTVKNVREGTAEAITLMTIHASKGLEFKHVFIAGLEEGTLPHINALESDIQVEEERRLMYVAMTRARERLYLSYSHRQRFRPDLPAEKSRFLREIPDELLEHERSNLGANAYKNFARSDFKSTFQSVNSSPSSTQNKTALAATISSSEPSEWQRGSRVRHKVFGVGVVQNVEKSLDGFRIEVRFPMIGVKKLLHTYLSPEG